MTFFRELGDSPIAWIFTLLSLVYFINGVRLGVALWYRRARFAEEPLKPWKKDWADRAAFLLAVPPGVFVHELFHALAVWLFGGNVVDVGYGFYWGYVSHTGTYTLGEQWFISLAGTLGTLLYGFALWLLLRWRPSTAWRYFGLRVLRFHLVYGLVYYPLFTLFTFIGDWRVIYNFDATPLLSGVTLVVHLIAVILFWWSDRQGAFEMPAFRSEAEKTALDTLLTRAAQNPDDEPLQLQVIEALWKSGAEKEAREQLRTFLQRHPRSAKGHLLQAFLEQGGRQHVSRRARRHATEALRLGLSEPANIASARTLLAQHYLQVERFDEALRHLDEAIARTDTTSQPHLAHLLYQRAIVHRRRGAYAEAEQDIARAVHLAETSGKDENLARYRHEQSTIAHHLGKQFPGPPM